ncbi:MAG: O-antigen ligase family protein [Planctomycetota bacterium]|jgi:O-antigen ligase
MLLAPLALLLLLTIPFQSLWPDFELARRGLLILLAGIVMLRARSWWPGKLPSGSMVFGLLLFFYLLRCIEITNPSDGFYRYLYLLSLGVLMLWGSSLKIDGLLRACLPVTLIVSLYGLAQAFGLIWPEGYALDRSTGLALPVSSLGNLNVASEVISIGASLAALHCARLPRSGWALLTLATSIACLMLNGSRSAWLALPLAAVLILIGAPKRRTLLSGIALGILLGSASMMLRPSLAKEAELPRQESRETLVQPSTIAVRLGIWAGCWELFQERWFLGHGSGAFPVEYPRVRREEEIELSSFGRQFRTGVESAHNDTIEVAVETGILGLTLWLAFWASALSGVLRHGERGLSRLAVPLAFLALSLVRSPLGNAPAAAMCFVFLGAVLRRRHGDQDWVPSSGPSSWLAIPVGLALIVLGAGPFLSQVRAASYLSGFKQGQPQIEVLDQAIWLNGSDRKLRQLRMQQRMRELSPGEALQASTEDLVFFHDHSPYNGTDLLLLAEIYLRAGQLDSAQAYVVRALQEDLRDPEAVLLLASIYCQQGEAGKAAATLYADPHPRLRAGLPRHLSDLADAAAASGDETGNRLLGREQVFMTAVLECEADPLSEASKAAVLAFGQLAGASAPRALALSAYLELAAGNRLAAEDLGRQAASGQAMNRASKRLMPRVIEELEGVPVWADYLSR